MELHAVEAARLVAYANVRAGGGVRAKLEAFGDLCHIVAVAHPRHALFGKDLEELAARIEERLGLAVFARGRVVRRHDLAAEVVGDEVLINIDIFTPKREEYVK